MAASHLWHSLHSPLAITRLMHLLIETTHTNRVNASMWLYETEPHKNPHQRDDGCTGTTCRTIFSPATGWLMLCADCMTVIIRNTLFWWKSPIAVWSDYLLRAAACSEMCQMAFKQITLDDIGQWLLILVHRRLGSTSMLIHFSVFASETWQVLSVGGRSLCSQRWLHNICLCSALCGQGCSDSAVNKILWSRDKITSELLECINVGRNANVLPFSSVLIYRYPSLFASCVSACVGLSVGAGQSVGWSLKVLKEVFFCSAPVDVYQLQHVSWLR